MQDQETATFQPKQKSRFPGGFKVATILLLVVVIGLVLVMALIWKPWQPNIKASDRVITVTGEAALKATPDEYIFSPRYDFSDADKQTALGKLTAASNQIVAKLKTLGVTNSAIQTNSSGYANGSYAPVTEQNGQVTYSLQLTVTINDAALAQKVQDYLVTTSPTGEVTPSVTFSTALQKSLENKARNQAEQDARANADQSAKNLGFKIASVKTVEDGGLNTYGGGGICAGASLDTTTPTSPRNLTLQPGQNQLYYSVQVEFYIH